ncbi:MAG: radical SAM protein [Elusimicrobiota bacterium]
MSELAYLQITRRCDQSCRFCSNPSNGRMIPLRRAKKWIDRFVKEGYAGLILTGGEPTLHPELDKIIRYTVDKKKVAARVITNGQKISDFAYLERLRDAGLRHLHVSVYSHQTGIMAQLTRRPNSLPNIIQALDNAAELGMHVDVNTVINRYNADHLSRIVEWICGRWPAVRHFVWNNMDPTMNRASDNPDTVPRLKDFELELYRAMSFLESTGRTFRCERVPLCFMTDFAHCSTETRKLVKSEGRAIYFLDEKGIKFQNTKGFWNYSKAPKCAHCPLNSICAGLYEMDTYYSSDELCPVFVSKEAIVDRVLRSGEQA